MKILIVTLAGFFFSSSLLISCSQGDTVNNLQFNNEKAETSNTTRKTFNRNQPSLKFVFSNSTSTSITPKNNLGKISQDANKYIEKVLYEMETNFIRRKEINWPQLYQEVYKLTANAQTTHDTYIGIVKAMQILNEKHTFFIMPDGQTLSMYSNLSSTYKKQFRAIENSSQVPGNIGYVKVTEFMGDSVQETAFAKQVESQVIEQDKKHPIGWIVDLRGNEGGNMWPMLAGLYPILGNENPGYFLDPDGTMSPWGEYLAKCVETYKLIKYQLENKNPKVAVLLDKNVASSGEATAISFIGRPATKSFGQETMGFSTANSSIPMSDGATLVLTSGYLVDRNKKSYSDKVFPDVLVQNEALTMQTAIKWLQN